MKHLIFLLLLISTSALGATTKIKNSSIANDAAIAHSKMAALTADRVCVTNGSGFVSASSITATVLGYVDATSSIQTQLNGKQALDATLTALAGATTASDKLAYFSGVDTVSIADLTAAGRAMIAAVSAAAQTALLDAFVGDSGSGGTKGLVPAPGIGDAANCLLGDGTWGACGGGGGSLISKDISQTGHGFTVGEAIYFDGTDYDEAQADDDTTSEVVGVVSAVADANNFTMVMAGEITGLSGLTAGTTYYLSEATAGLLTATAPTGVGEVSKPVLVASSTTGGYVIQSRGAIISDGSGGGGGTITDWESDNDVVVPDTFGTVSNFRGFKKRIGDSLTVRFNFTTGTVPSSTSTFSLGDSLVIDEAKLSSGGMGQQVGRCMTLGGTDTAFVNDGGHDVVIFYDGSDETKLYVAYIITSGAYKKVTTNNLIGSSTNIDCRIEDLPIVGW